MGIAGGRPKSAKKAVNKVMVANALGGSKRPEDEEGFENDVKLDMKKPAHRKLVDVLGLVKFVLDLDLPFVTV